MEQLDPFIRDLFLLFQKKPLLPLQEKHLKQTLETYHSGAKWILGEEELDLVNAGVRRDSLNQTLLTTLLAEREEVLRNIKDAQAQGELADVARLQRRLAQLESEIQGC